jgi:FMN-dependent dehydrogenase
MRNWRLGRGLTASWFRTTGGRNLDTVIPPIEALPEITQQVAGRVPVLVDGGIRRGTDALKALVRGANAVALAVAGAEGVARCLSLLIEELRLAMPWWERLASGTLTVTWSGQPNGADSSETGEASRRSIVLNQPDEL